MQDLVGDPSGKSWTATFTATDGYAGTGSVTVGNAWQNAAGNSGTGGADNVPIDTVNPTVVVNIVDASLNDGDSASVVTFTFTEAPVNFTAADITAVGGSISNLVQDLVGDPSGKSWTATFTATDGYAGTGSVTVGNAWQNAAGNSGTGGADNVPIDTVNPTVVVNIVDASLNDGDSASVVTFTFTEAPVNFTAADITAVGGSISNLVQDLVGDPSGKSWTATFTATDGYAGTGSVTVGNAWQNAAGNAGVGSADTVVIDRVDPIFTINDVVVNENAGTASFTVTLSKPSGSAISVDFNTSNGTAISGSDYSSTSGTLTFAPGDLTQTVTVPIYDDGLFEGSESFNVVLSNAVNASIGDSTGVGTIVDNETPPTLAVSSVTVAESAGFAQFTVSLSRPSAASTTVSLSLAGVSATGGGVDFSTAGAGNLQVSTNGGLTWTDATSYTFNPGATSVLVRSPIVDDLLYEPAPGETFTLTATTTTGTTANPSVTGTATITDNDSQPQISVSDAFVQEGGQLVFTVTLSNPSAQSVSVNYATANNTATAGATLDYTAVSGSLSFAPGEVSKTVVVQTRADAIAESNETLYLNLSSPTNATIADNQGVGTIMETIQAVLDSGTVYESALASGTLPASTGEIVTGNLLANDYSPGSKTVNQVTFGTTSYTASGNVITVDTPLGLLQVYTAAGTYGGVARAAGDYVYTLQTNSTAGNNVSEQFTYRIADGSNTSTANLNIRIVDDAPVGTDVTETLQAASSLATYNLVIILDVSGSMDTIVTGTKTRMEIAKESLGALFDKFDDLGNVNIQITTFSSTVTESAWFNDDRYGAIDYVNALAANGSTYYSDALTAVMTGFSQPTADKTLFYFISDGAPTSGHEATLVQSSWETFVTNNGDIAFGIGIGGATTSALEPVSFPNTDTNGDGQGDYTIQVSNEADLAATLLQTVDGGVVVGNVSVLSGGGSSGLLLGADGGHISNFTVDGTTYSYVSGGPESVTVSTLKGGSLTVDYLSGTYSYQLQLTKTIQGEQEVVAVTGIDGDGDTKTINVVINLDYVANLDANRDIILTNVVDGSPLTISQAALMHNDSTGSSASVSGTSNAQGGTVSGTTNVIFDLTDSEFGASYSVINEETFNSGAFAGDKQSTPKNNTYQTAMDLTNRALFGPVAGAEALNVTNPALPSVKVTGTLSAGNGERDDDYIKVHLKAGETITLDIDRGIDQHCCDECR